MNGGRRMSSRRNSVGLSLIELMIALLLGTLIIGAAIGIFLANRQTYRTTDSLGRIQENVRTAFELMARDMREAAGNPCSNSVPLVNVINSPSTRWWTRLDTWGNAARGYGGTEAFADSAFGSGAAQRISGTDAIELISTDSNVSTVRNHDPAAASLLLNRTNHGFVAGDLALVCNPRQASIFQVSSVSGSSIGHGTGGTPGNCTAALGMPLNCGGGATFKYPQPSSVVARLSATRWFIANNPNGRPSLYQTRLTSTGPVSQEVVEGVNSMTFTYLLDGAGSYVAAAAVGANWPKLKAVRVSMTFVGEPNTGAGGVALTRTLTQVVSIRNRNP